MEDHSQTPLRCPLCEGELVDARIQHIGDVTARLIWQIHAGRCPEHGWFQAEVISRPPREIFPVNRPGGIARRVVIDGKDFYAFPTIWNSLDPLEHRADPLDAKYWAIDWDHMRVAAPSTSSS
jgi:hypothetical protein